MRLAAARHDHRHNAGGEHRHLATRHTAPGAALAQLDGEVCWHLSLHHTSDTDPAYDSAMRLVGFVLLSCLAATSAAGATTTIRIMPPDGGVLAAGQRVDIRVEASSDGSTPPDGLRV